jgi:hypothetical protein
MKNIKNKGFIVETTIEIPEQRVSDLLVSAFEGGSGYWARLRGYDADMADDIVAGKRSLGITEDCGEGEPPVEHVLDRKAVARGLKLFAELEPRRHFQGFLSEGDDAETGDVFLQMCLLGKIVYG